MNRRNVLWTVNWVHFGDIVVQIGFKLVQCWDIFVHDIMVWFGANQIVNILVHFGLKVEDL